MPFDEEPPLERPSGRNYDALRPLSIELGTLRFAEGSALIAMGHTMVLAAASVESRVPPFLLNQGRGWVTAEYAMLPRATPTRAPREVTRGRPSGRSSEIQRLIGRSLRAVVDTAALGERTVTIDCDVVQADGGTRTAAITAAYVALVQALAPLLLMGEIERWPMIGQVAAVSVGLLGGVPILDLEYVEDRDAEVDLNVVATADRRLVEIQGTGEERSFSRQELDALLDLAQQGIARLVVEQNATLAPVLEEVEEVLGKGRSKAEPKDERSLWQPPS